MRYSKTQKNDVMQYLFQFLRTPKLEDQAQFRKSQIILETNQIDEWMSRTAKQIIKQKE